MKTSTTTRGGRGAARGIIGWVGVGLALAALALPLGACRQEGPAEQAGKKIDEAVDDTKTSVSKAAENAREIAKDAAEDVGDAVEKAAENTKEMAKDAKEKVD